MTAGGEVVEDYGHVGLTLREHPRRVPARRICSASASSLAPRRCRPGTARWLEAAGLVLVRQRPGSAKGVMFITIEDETGIANLVVWPQVFEKFRRVVIGASMMAVHGRIQREGEVVHLVAHRLIDLSAELASVGSAMRPSRCRTAAATSSLMPAAGPIRANYRPGACATRDIYVPDLHIDTIKVKGRNFH